MQIKLRQLLSLSEFHRVILSSDDPEVFQQASNFGDSRLVFDQRPEALARSSTPLAELIMYAATLSSDDYLAWTHVTSPFFGTNAYREALSQFGNPTISEDASMISARKHQNYFMFGDGNFVSQDAGAPNWPRTQDLQPIFEVDSGLFIASRRAMLFEGRRTSNNFKIFETDIISSLDIDWEADFQIAKQIWDLKIA